MTTIEQFNKLKDELQEIYDVEVKEDAKWALGLRYAIKIINEHLKHLTPQSGKEEAYRTVFDDLNQINLFTGIYDAKHGKREYMYGVFVVMEHIARGISEECYEQFSDTFFENMRQSLGEAD